MYKKSETEKSFLYDDKKGLEYSVLRDNEFSEKIKIKSEKLEEDYKTTINISEQNNEENEFFLSEIKLIFFSETELDIEKIYNDFEENYKENTNKCFYEIIANYEELAFPKKFLEESVNPLIDYSPKECGNIEKKEKNTLQECEYFYKEIINSEKEMRNTIYEDKNYYRNMKEVFIKKDNYIIYDYKSSDEKMANFEIECHKGKPTFNGLTVKELIENGKLGNSKKVNELEKNVDLFIDALSSKILAGKIGDKILSSFQEEFKGEIMEISAKERKKEQTRKI
jgi:hypothetical protein